jgi:hypothetical protein
MVDLGELSPIIQGDNELTLTEDTMRQAVEHYLNEVLFRQRVVVGRVTSYSETSSGPLLFRVQFHAKALD